MDRGVTNLDFSMLFGQLQVIELSVSRCSLVRLVG